MGKQNCMRNVSTMQNNENVRVVRLCERCTLYKSDIAVEECSQELL